MNDFMLCINTRHFFYYYSFRAQRIGILISVKEFDARKFYMHTQLDQFIHVLLILLANEVNHQVESYTALTHTHTLWLK